jgi:hypothetical protein
MGLSDRLCKGLPSPWAGAHFGLSPSPAGQKWTWQVLPKQKAGADLGPPDRIIT